jgi:tetratricopeptide (TPR) repeat protein
MAGLQVALGNLDAAIELNRRAVELDPLALNGYASLGSSLMWDQQLDEALTVYEHLQVLNPEAATLSQTRSRILLMQGKKEQAMVAAEAEQEPFWHAFGTLFNLYAQGRTAEADALLQEFIEKNQHDGAYQIALIYGFRGDEDRVFEWLERAYAQRDGGLTQMLYDPVLAQFSGNPRWSGLLKKVGVYESWLKVRK